MKKTLLIKKYADNVIGRINSLSPNTAGKWGSMEVTEMLHHCQRANTLILDGKADNAKTNLKQTLLKLSFLYVFPAFPKNIKGPARIDPKKAGITVDQFPVEKQKLIDTINQFQNRREPIDISHPMFGKLNNKEWGVITWMHMDHHLRQFGV